MPEVEEKIGLGSRFEIQRVISNFARERAAVQREERERFRQAIRLEAELQRRHFLPRLILGSARVDPFQPCDAAAELSQTKGPLEIDPEMPAALRIRDRP